MRHRPKHIAEYIALRGFAALIRLLPYRLGLALAWWHAALFFFVFRFRVAEAQRRILQVFGPACSRRRARAIAWRSMRNMAFNLVEVIRSHGGATPWLPPHIEYQASFEKINEQARSGKGAILAAPHMGNWELAGILGPRLGIPMFTIVGVQKNPLVNAFIQDLRAEPNVELIPRGSGMMRAVLRNLKQGKMLALLPDVRSRHPGVLVDFLGGRANLFKGTALFAFQTHVPVFLCLMRREGWTHHHVSVIGPFTPAPEASRDEAVASITQQLMSRIDEAIRSAPEQWFWFNKRWILDPLPPTDSDS